MFVSEQQGQESAISAPVMQVRFAEAAKRSRRALAAGGAGSLLRGFRVHVHSSDQATRGLPNNAPALKRLTVALGGKVCVNLSSMRTYCFQSCQSAGPLAATQRLRGLQMLLVTRQLHGTSLAVQCPANAEGVRS